MVVRSHRASPAVAVCLFITTTVACGGDPVGPSTDGTYSLRQLNGQPLPYDHGGLGCCIYRGGGLELGTPRYTIHVTARNRINGIVFTATEWGSFEREGTAITFQADSADVAAFLLDVAAASGDTIRVAFGGEGPGSPDQFHGIFVRDPYVSATRLSKSRGAPGLRVGKMDRGEERPSGWVGPSTGSDRRTLTQPTGTIEPQLHLIPRNHLPYATVHPRLILPRPG